MRPASCLARLWFVAALGADPPAVAPVPGMESEQCRAKMRRSSDPTVLVTGMARTGTTILSMLVKNHPKLMGGWELGFLHADRPSNYAFGGQLTRGNKTYTTSLWDVSDEDLTRIMAAECFADMYSLLHEASPYLRGTDRRIVDKHPAYSKILSTVLERAPPRTRVLVSVKHGFIRHGIQKALAGPHAHRIGVVNYTELLISPHVTMRRVFSFLGVGASSWRESYLNMTGWREKIEAIVGANAARALVNKFRFKADGGPCDIKNLQLNTCHSR